MRFLLTETVEGYMQEILEGLDSSSLNNFLNEHMRGKMGFEELISLIATDGLGALNKENICTFFFDTLFYELSVAQPIFMKMLLFSVLFSVLQRLLATKNRYISRESLPNFLHCFWTGCHFISQLFPPNEPSAPRLPR